MARKRRKKARAVQQQLEAASSAPAGPSGDGTGTAIGAPGETMPSRSDLAKLFHAIPAGETADASALVESTGLGLDAVLSLLVELEIMGFLTRYPGPVWGRSGSPPTKPGE